VVGRERPLGRTDGLQALQLAGGLREDFLYVFTFYNPSNAGIFITIFYLTLFKAIFVNILISIVAILR